MKPSHNLDEEAKGPDIMGEKVKLRTYGRRPRKQDIAEAFGTLTLSEDDRSPLADRSVNASTTLPALSTLKQENKRSGTALDVPEARPIAKSQIVPQAIEKKSTVNRPDQPPQRRLRSEGKGTPRISDGKSTEEDAYLKPLTKIADVESVVQQFNLWAETMDKLLSVVMIGDGSYANVFRLSSRSNPEIYSIAKLIPLRASRGPRSRSPDSTTIENAANEVRMLATMSGTKGFTDFKKAMLLRGQLPQSFRKACKAFELDVRSKKGTTQTSEQCRRLNYPKQQLWLFLEMGDAGEELETVLLKGLENGEPPCENRPKAGHLTVQQTRDIFYLTVETLALGERDAEFEHRDLHLSNVCLRWNEQNSNARPLDPGWQLVPKASSMSLTLIDYTLSRAKTDEGTVFNRMNDEVGSVEVNLLQSSKC